MEVKPVQISKLEGVWRTCNKIRAAVFRIGLNVRDHFKVLDPSGCTLVSESKFVNVLANQLRSRIGLSNEEIEELTDYFRVQDGRILYTQFCDLIHNNVADNTKNPDLVSGLEWEDPLQVNRLSESENRRLCVLLTKIAQTVRLRELVLLPYFQDYELIANNHGTVTLAHYSRVLHFLKIVISSDDYQLLLKRYMKNSYTVNYVAFVRDIEKIVEYLDAHRMVDLSEDIIRNFPGRLINVELPKLPRPEIGTVKISDVFGKETSFHCVLKSEKLLKPVDETILRIMKHVDEYHIRINQYFEDFDILKTGKITRSQFIRALDLILLAGLHRLYLSDKEIKNLCERFADDTDSSRVNWKEFSETIDKVFTVKHLDKKPYEIIIVPPTEVKDLKPEGNANWQEQSTEMRDLCTQTLYKMKAQISNRRLYLLPSFKMYDRHNNSHVTRTQMRQVLLTNGALLSDQELYALERRYNDDLGFHYIWFLNEADPQDYALPKFEEYRDKMILVNQEKVPRDPTYLELDIVHVLGKIKGQAVRNRVRIVEFLKGFDKHNEQCICETDFRRGVDTANIKLNNQEMDLVCKVFKSPLRKESVDYKRFCKVIDETFFQTCLEKAPLIVPLQHFPSDDNPGNFLNFEERAIVSMALQKLAHYSDQVTNIKSIFEDYDHVNCGTISQNNFLRGLTVRNLHIVVSSREFEVLCKCFGVERGLRQEVDYRRFVQCLDVLFTNKSNYPF